MKFNDELILPAEIACYVGKYVSIKTISKMNQVCKGWNSVFSDDHFWKLRFETLGIDSKVEVLKQKFSSTSYKELFKLLTSREFFLSYTKNSAVDNSSGFLSLPINPEVFEIINGWMLTPDVTLTAVNREVKNKLFLYRSNLTIFDSVAQYVALKEIDSRCIRPIRQVIPKDSSFVQGSNPELLALCNNNSLLKNSVLFLNSEEFNLPLLFQMVLTLSGQIMSREARSNKMATSLIRTGMNSLYYIFSFKAYMTDLIELNFQETPADPNNEVNLTIEITENNWNLLDYRVLVSEDLYPQCKDIFQNVDSFKRCINQVSPSHIMHKLKK